MANRRNKWNEQEQGAKRRRSNQSATKPAPAASNPNKNTKSTDTKRNSGKTAAAKPAPKQNKPKTVYYSNKNKGARNVAQTAAKAVVQKPKAQTAAKNTAGRAKARLSTQTGAQRFVTGRNIPTVMNKPKTFQQTVTPLEQMKADALTGPRYWASRATVPSKPLTSEERKQKNQQTAKQSGFNARARMQTLSSYDRNLPQGKQFQIQQAKQRWDEAKAKGDRAGMEKAHREAEALRYTSGYSGGATGNERITPKLSQDNYNRLNSAGRLAMTQAQMTRDRAVTEEEIARADRRIEEILNAPGYQNGRDINTARGMRETAEGRSTMLGATREQKEQDFASLPLATKAGIHLGVGGLGVRAEGRIKRMNDRMTEQNMATWLRDADNYIQAQSDLERYDSFVAQFGVPPDDLPSNRNVLVMRLNDAIQARAQLNRMWTDPQSAWYDPTQARRLGTPDVDAYSLTGRGNLDSPMQAMYKAGTHPDFENPEPTYFEQMFRKGQEEQAASQEGLNPAEKWVNDLYISMIQNAPSTLAAFVPGGQGGAMTGLAMAARGLSLAGMGESSAGARMVELEDQGYPFEEAFRHGTAAEVAEIAGEGLSQFGLGKMVAGQAEKFFGKTWAQPLIEGLEELGTYTGNWAYSKANDLPGKKFDWREALSQTAAGAAMGAVHTGAGVMVNSLLYGGTARAEQNKKNYQVWQASADQARSLLNDAKQWYAMIDQGAVSREEGEAALSQVSQQINGQAEPVTREWLARQEELLDIEENAIRGAITRQEARDQQSQIMDQAMDQNRDAEANRMAAEWDEAERQERAAQNAAVSARTRLDQSLEDWRWKQDEPVSANPVEEAKRMTDEALRVTDTEMARREAAQTVQAEMPPVQWERSGLPPTSFLGAAIDARRESRARAEAEAQVRRDQEIARQNRVAAEQQTISENEPTEIGTYVLRNEQAQAQQPVSRLEGLASTFGESGAASLRTIGGKIVTGRGAFVRDFTNVYNQVLGGRTERQVSRPAGMSDANFFAAVTAAKNDRQTGWDLDILKASKAAGRNVNAGVDWRDKYVRQMDRKTARTVDGLAKALGVKVVFAEQGSILTAGGARANAEITGNVVRIEKGNPNPVRMLIGHELTHRMQDLSPDSYRAFRDYVMSIPGSMEALERTVSLYQGAKAFRAEDNVRQMAMDEVTADYAGALLENSEQLQELIRRNYENRTMLEVIRDFFRDLAAKLSGREKAQADEAVRLLEEAIKGAEAKLEQRPKTQDAREELAGTVDVVTEVGVQIDPETKSAAPIQFSLGSWNRSEYVQDRDEAAKALAKQIKVTQKEAKRFIDSVNSVAKMIAEDRARLDYRASPGQSAFVSNTEYGGSIDFSTICKKRRLFTGTIDAIQRAMPDRVLMADEMLKIRAEMKKRGYEVGCGLCYVEGSRVKIGKYTKEFLDELKAEGADYIPTLAEMNTVEGQEDIRLNHPETYEKYVKFMNKLAQRKPKLFQMATEYNREILDAFEGKEDSVKEKNKNGGLRLQSFSDFEIIHLIDSMQVIMDMSRVGLAGQAYTKQPEFAWALGGTGLKINLSLIAKGVDENGRLIFDDVEGMPIDEAMKLRNRYSKNVGTIICTFNLEQTMAAMADDRIDFIIPFHHSQWKKSQYKLMGLPDKTKSMQYWQNERYIKPVYGKKKDGTPKLLRAQNFMPNEYWDFHKSGKWNAEQYLKMCAEGNKRPKFWKLLVDNKDGSYSLQPDGSTDGYWKLLIDFKMYDNEGKGSPQKPVRPEFNMAEAKRMLDEYSGGHEKFPVAQDIVDEFVGGARFSISAEDGYNVSGNTASYTDERINTVLKEYGGGGNYAQGFVTYIDPNDFLKLTLSDSTRAKWEGGLDKGEFPEEFFPLDEEKLRNNRQSPYLRVDTATGEVEGHEGRHRMLALARAGITKAPVVLVDTATKYSKEPTAQMRLTSQDFGDGPVNGGYSVTVENLLPTNKQYREQIKEAYGGEDARVRFSISPQADAIEEEYQEALDANDPDWQAMLVQQAAFQAGYTTGAYHGSPFTDITVFNTRSTGEKPEKLQLLFGTHFTQSRDFAEIYAKKGKKSKGTSRMTSKRGKVYDVYLNLGKSLDLRTPRNYQEGDEIFRLYQDLPEKIKKKVPKRTYTEADVKMGMPGGDYVNTGDMEKALQAMTPRDATDFLVAHGYNSVKYLAAYNTGEWDNNRFSKDPSIIMLDPERIKSADPVTYDDDGNVIPLSERFNAEREDIRYSIAPETIDPVEITPVNEVRDRGMYDYLVSDFEENGWNGRPLVVVENGNNGYLALTGSHRIAAAMEAEIDVPAIILDNNDDILRLLDANDDDERESVARELAEDGIIPQDVANLIIRENDLNFENWDVPYEQRKRYSIGGVDNVVAFPQNRGRSDAQMDKTQLEAEINAAGLSLKSKDNNKNNLRIKGWIKENHPDLVDKVKFFNDKTTGTVTVREIQDVTDFERQEQARKQEMETRQADEQDRKMYGIVYDDDDLTDSGLIRSYENRDAVVAAVRDYLGEQDGISDVTVHKSGGMGSFATFYIEATNADDEKRTVRFSGHDSKYYGADVYLWNNSYSNVSDLLKDIRDAIVFGTDIRHSLSGPESLDSVRLMRENQLLREKLDYWKGQTKRSDRTKADPREVKKLAGKLAKDYSTEMDAGEIAGRLQTIYDGIGKDWSYDRAYEEAGKLARDMIEQASETDDYLYAQYEPMRKFFQDTALVVTPEMKRAIPDYNEWRKAQFGKLRLQSGDQTNVDQVFQEAAQLWPEWFSEDVSSNSLDQLERIVEVMDGIYTRDEVNPFEDDMAAPAGYLAAEIMDRFWDMPAVRKTFADRAEARLGREVTRRLDMQERYENALQRVRENRDKKLKQQKEKYLGREKARSQRQKERELRGKILRHCKKLSTKLTTPTDTQHIPDGLQDLVATALKSINLSSKDSKDTKRTKAFADLQKRYLEILSEGSSIVIDPDLIPNISDIIGFADTPIENLGMQDLETIWRAVRAIEASISTANKALGRAKFETISQVADAIRDYLQGRKDRGDYRGPIKAFDKLMNFGMLTPEGFFSRLGQGGKDVFKMLRAAQDHHISIMQDAQKWANKLVKGWNIKRLEKETRTFDFDGQSVTMSNAQIMSLYELMKRQQAIDHIMVGGLRPETVKRGIKERRPSVPWHLTQDQVAEIVGSLSEEEVKLADEIQQYMEKVLAELGNEASLAVYGYRKFTEKHYFPIAVDKNQTVSDVKNDAVSGTIAGWGSARPVKPNARNALIVRSIFDVFADHTTEMANYAAWLGPMENLNRTFNYRYKDEGGNLAGGVKDLLERAFGENGSAYWRQLQDDLNNGVHGRNDNPFQALIGAYKGSAIGANIRVIAQQPTAILRALDEINPADFIAGVALSKPGKFKNVVMKYAPIAVWKNWGYFTADTGRQMRNVLFNDDSGVQRLNNFLMQGAGTADSVAWTHIWNAVEVETRRKRKDLKPGSEAFYESVAERFGDIVDHTQVVDGILQRSQIMRSPDNLTKMATSFMAEPTKVYNMMTGALYDARNATGPERSKAMRKLARTSVALLASFVANAAAQSLVDALRDDDKDEEYWEKFFQAFWGGEGDSRGEKIKDAILNGNVEAAFNPATYIPWAKDIVSLTQGFNVSRMDMDTISRVMKEVSNTLRAMSGEGKLTKKNAILRLSVETARFLGIPAANLKRDIMSGMWTIYNETHNYRQLYEMEKFLYDPTASNNQKEFVKILFAAQQAGDQEAYQYIRQDLVASGVEEKKLDDKLGTMMKDETVEGGKMEEQYHRVYDAYEEIMKVSPGYQSLTAEQQEKVQNSLSNYATGKVVGEESGGDVEANTSNEAKAIAAAEAAGVDPVTWKSFKVFCNDATADKDENGESIRGSKKAKAEKWLKDNGITGAQYDYCMEHYS